MTQPNQEDPLDSIDPTAKEAIRRDVEQILRDLCNPLPQEPAVRHSPNARREKIDGFIVWVED